MNKVFGFCLAAATVFAAAASAASLNGGGGTAVHPVMSLWAQNYKRDTGIAVNYQPIGSGGGIRQTIARTIDFGNTDQPLNGTRLVRNKLVQFPILILSIVPVVNLPGIAPGEIVLDGRTLADIYLGKLTRWDDPAIQKLNPAAKLPKLSVIVVHRSDASGMSFNFTSYLSKVSPEWKSQVGSDTAVAWPIGLGAKGNAGVTVTLMQTQGAIAYVEYTYALQNKLTFTGMVNQEGQRVEPNMETFRSTAERAEISNVEDFHLVLADRPGEASWPLMATTYMLMRTDTPVAKNRAILKFLSYGLHGGKADAVSLNYVPLPQHVVEQVEAAWRDKLHAWP
jgi:phosphate transport system substrate-binding protein